MGHGALAAGHHDRIPEPVARVSADRPVDDPAVLPDVVMDDRPVSAGDRMCRELLRERLMRHVVSGHHQQSARILVDPMDDPGTQHPVDRGELISVSIKQSVDQRSGR